MVFENLKIHIHFLHTPSEIRASIFAVTQFAAARHYAQCHFKQNMHYSIGGVEKTKNRIPTQGGDDKKMCTAPRAGTRKPSFSTPLAREARFWFAKNVAVEKKGCWRLGGSNIALQNRVHVKTVKIIRGLPFEMASAYSTSCKSMPEVKNLSASNTFTTNMRRNRILAREGLQTSKM